MYSVIELLNLTIDFLKQKGFENSRRCAEELIGEVLKIGRLGVYTEHDRPLTQSEVDLCRDALKRRSKNEPLQYIIGSVDFFDCHFKVDKSVLIPRHETEILVDKIAGIISKDDLEGKALLDLCCGSGCIGISLKKKFPMLNISLSDISEDAVKLAKENAKINNVDVNFFVGDFFAPLKDRKFDYIICNPPYISNSEYSDLEKEVKNFEPKLALVAGDDGLEFYKKLSNELYLHLNKSSKAWFEIGYLQAEPVKSLFLDTHWKKKEIEKDYSLHDRFFSLETE